MPKIVPIVEGDGEMEAVPILLRRILHDRLGAYDWRVGLPKKAHGLPALRKKLSNFIRYAQIEPEATHILIILDLDDGCPMIEAQALAEEIRQIVPCLPVAVVLAHREYEAWFLASLPSLAGRDGLPPDAFYGDDVENIRGVKGWITRQMPRGSIYKETSHQPAWSAQMDLDMAEARSRSFQRLLNAITFLRDSTSPVVSPFPTNAII